MDEDKKIYVIVNLMVVAAFTVAAGLLHLLTR